MTKRNPEEEPKIVINDHRRIDPKTGEVREASAGGDSAGAAGTDEVPGADGASAPGVASGATADEAASGLRAQLDERTADLQRLTAEYANYRRRVERDRAVAGESATAAVLSALLPVLDDLDRARQHGDLIGAFASVAEQLSVTLQKLGLQPFGERGDPFDPNRHEAVMHTESAEVSVPTAVDVMRKGYSLGDRQLRPAMVAVADPAPPASAPAPAGPADSGDQTDSTGPASESTSDSDPAAG
jgi:molecular chaperone GrpE